MITAEHILSRTKGDEVTAVFHKSKPDGGYEKAPAKLRVRQGGKVLWKKHPTIDVAILPITPPPEALPAVVPIDLLATDADLEKYEIHPGDSVRCLGFPHPNQFEPSEAGFGVVRAGCIAGYPLLPTRTTKTFLLDLNSFEGDSGAPVYLVDDHRLLDGQDRAQPRAADPGPDDRPAFPRRGVQDDLPDRQVPPPDGLRHRRPRLGHQGDDRPARAEAGAVNGRAPGLVRDDHIGIHKPEGASGG